MKQQESLDRVLACVGKPQQVRAAINAEVRARVAELVGQRHPKTASAWHSVEHEALDLGRWLASQAGQEFNTKLPALLIRHIRHDTGTA